MACTTSFTLSFISLPLFHFLSGTFVISFPFPPFPNPFVCSSPLVHTLSPSCSHSLASLIVCLFHFPSLLLFFPHFINSFFFISSPFRTLSYSASFSKITHTLSLLLLFFISRVCVCARRAVIEHTGRMENSSFFSSFNYNTQFVSWTTCCRQLLHTPLKLSLTCVYASLCVQSETRKGLNGFNFVSSISVIAHLSLG